jgi:type IV secretory pathway ATPase VirB11/archaellum biosynthesis ATPase
VVALAGALSLSVQSLAERNPQLFIAEIKDIEESEVETSGSAVARQQELEALLTEDLRADLEMWIEVRANILIVGRNGSGKTSLLRLLARRLPANEDVNFISRFPTPYLDHPRATIYVPSGKMYVPCEEGGKDISCSWPAWLLVDEIQAQGALNYLLAIASSDVTGSIATYGSKRGGVYSSLAAIEDEIVAMGLDKAALAGVDIVVALAHAPETAFDIVDVSQVIYDRAHNIEIRNLYDSGRQGLCKSKEVLALGAFTDA